jgi:hypothetical protein
VEKKIKKNFKKKKKKKKKNERGIQMWLLIAE